MNYRGNKHEITLAEKTFWVDSNQEEYLLNWLEENGFTERWERYDQGVNVGRNNYTPDLELSVQFEGMTHRAIVESKPIISAFTPYVSRRMRGIAKHYFTSILLLYVHDVAKWYRVDIKTGELSDFTPIPGEIPIKKLYRPLTKKARSVRYHRYRQRLNIGKTLTTLLLNVFESAVKELVRSHTQPKRRRRSRRR